MSWWDWVVLWVTWVIGFVMGAAWCGNSHRNEEIDKQTGGEHDATRDTRNHP